MELLEILNSWWKEKTIGRALALPYHRKIFTEIKKLMALRQIVVISGLRRVGKSTLMYQLIEELLKTVNAENILYFSFDEKLENPIDVLKSYSELTRVDWKKEKCFIFFDEIQKLSDWGNKIKIIYDNFPNLKIILSGSSSFYLEKDAKSSLTGRHFITYVAPLSFAEYLELKGSKIDLSKINLWKDEIKKEFKGYLLRPFPEIVNFQELSLIKSYIKDNIIEKILKIDLADRFKALNESLLTRLVEIFYDRPGTYVNYDEISKELKVGKDTLIKHIYYLEFAYIIRRVWNFRPKARITSRKLQRIYPFHFALRFGWNGQVDFETVVASNIDAKYYWRKGEKEVDFLVVSKNVLPIEVKESSKINLGELKPLIYFMKTFNIENALLVFDGDEGELKTGGLTIKSMPLWKLAIEWNSIKETSN